MAESKPDQSIHNDETSPLKDLAAKWNRIIHAEGASLLHGKLHPLWLAVLPQEIRPLISEPGFSDGGHINCSPKRLILARSPLSGIPDELYKYGRLATAKRTIKPETQLLLMSAPREADNEYNLKMLDGRFSNIWQESVWAAKINSDPNVPARTPTATLLHKIFLPMESTTALYQDAIANPTLPQLLMQNMYPNVPLSLVSTTEILIKQLTASEELQQYTGPVDTGGVVLPL